MFTLYQVYLRWHHQWGPQQYMRLDSLSPAMKLAILQLFPEQYQPHTSIKEVSWVPRNCKSFPIFRKKAETIKLALSKGLTLPDDGDNNDDDDGDGDDDCDDDDDDDDDDDKQLPSGLRL